MAKKDDPPVDAFEDDGWDFGPPSARRSSLRPGVRRSLRPAADAVRAVEAQRKDDAKRVADQGFVESGWSEPPQADDEPTLIAAPNAVAAALAAPGVIPDAPVASVAPAVPAVPAVSVAAEPVVSVAPAPAISAAPPAPAVSVAPAVSAPPAARRAAVRPAATRTGPQPSLAQTARMRAATPISFPAEARPSVPALSIPAAAAKVSVPAAAAASFPAAAATASMPAVKASLPAAAAASAAATAPVSVAAAAPSVVVSTPAPTPVKEESVAPSSGPTIEIASEPPVAESHDREPDSVSGARLVHPSRRSPSPTASFRPVVPDTAFARVPAPRKRMTATNVLPLVSLVLSTMGIGFLMFGGSPSAEATTAARAEQVAVAARAAEPAKAPEHVPAKPARPAEPQNSKKPAEAQVAAAAPKKVEELPLAAAPTAVTPVAGDTVKVELSVYPYDAAVGYLGIMQKGGPRYIFEVPKGKSIAVEVARKGYGTRKVILDGTQAQLSIGLRKSKSE